MAATVTEVEVDVLTGMHQIRRCDFIEDTGCHFRNIRYQIAHLLHICMFSGLPTSPLVDVGQIEGGLVMALGMWTSEQV